MSGKTYPFFETEKDDISPLFTSKLQDQAHVGCLRGRFQDGGIAVDWFGGNEPLCTPEFDAELKDLLKNLCQDGPLDDSQRYEAFLPGTSPSKDVRARYLFCFSYRYQPVSLLFTSIPAKTEVFPLLLSDRSI
ncbi:MAG: hypothetical protein ACLT3D_00640 [Lawsonibacter sp.]